MMGALLLGLAALFVVVCGWKLALLGAAIGRLRRVSPRRRPLLSQAIRAHTLHLLLAGVGIALLLMAERLPGDVYLYVAPPPHPIATATVATPGTPPPTPPPTTPQEVHAMRLAREEFVDFPPFAPGCACDDEKARDDEETQKVKDQRARSVEEMGRRLAAQYNSNQLRFVLVVGTFDHTSLSPETNRRYDSNTALAQERAECVAQMLRPLLEQSAAGADWDEILHTMVAGPQHARGRHPTELLRARDRGVRILVGGDTVESRG
ncbi:MAG: hypothetical protein ABI629_00085 [bacterium]